jgi:hypothetical protein
MMKRDGCPPGLIPFRGICRKLEIPKIGTTKVLNIQNRQGCSAFGWDWDPKHNICLMEDELMNGMVAPVKGAVFYWDINDMGDFEPQYAGYYSGYIMGALYTDYSEISYLDGPYDETDLGDLADYLRETTISLAKDVRDGKAKTWKLSYFTPDGRPTTHLNPEAVAASKPQEVVEAYKTYERSKRASLMHKKPFAIHPGG